MINDLAKTDLQKKKTICICCTNNFQNNLWLIYNAQLKGKQQTLSKHRDNNNLRCVIFKCGAAALEVEVWVIMAGHLFEKCDILRMIASKSLEDKCLYKDYDWRCITHWELPFSHKKRPGFGLSLLPSSLIHQACHP